MSYDSLFATVRRSGVTRALGEERETSQREEVDFLNTLREGKRREGKGRKRKGKKGRPRRRLKAHREIRPPRPPKAPKGPQGPPHSPKAKAKAKAKARANGNLGLPSQIATLSAAKNIKRSQTIAQTRTRRTRAPTEAPASASATQRPLPTPPPLPSSPPFLPSSQPRHVRFVPRQPQGHQGEPVPGRRQPHGVLLLHKLHSCGNRPPVDVAPPLSPFSPILSRLAPSTHGQAHAR